MRCRPLLALIAAIVASAVAGCGGSSSSGAASSPTTDALSYVPSAAPFVLTIATDAKSRSIQEAQALERRFPLMTLSETALFAQLSKLGIDYAADIRPLLGNPMVLSALGTSARGSGTPFVLVWVTRSASGLKRLVAKLTGLIADGTHDGAALYSEAGEALAVAGPTLVLAPTTSDLRLALDRHADRRGFSSAQYAAATAGLAGDGFIEMFGNLAGALSAPAAAQARKVPWVAAIRGFGASLAAGAHGLTIRFHLDTSGAPLTAAELPIATGATAPSVAGGLPVEVAVRDPAQIVGFIERVLRETEPGTYAKLVRELAGRRRTSGLDFAGLLSMLSGDLNLETDSHSTIVRAQVSDPAAASRMIAGLTRPGALPGASRIRVAGGGLYALRTARSATTVMIGVVGDQLVLGRASPAAIRAFATAPAASSPSETGSISFRMGLVALLRATLRHPPSAIAQQFLGLLGDVTGSAAATTGGLTGTATFSLN